MNQTESKIRIRYAETDQMGVAYHGALVPWFEVGRTDWLRHHVMCYADLEKEFKVHLAVVEASLQYRRRISERDFIPNKIQKFDAITVCIAYSYKLIKRCSCNMTKVTRQVGYMTVLPLK